jgi:hypothetical protein
MTRLIVLSATINALIIVSPPFSFSYLCVGKLPMLSIPEERKVEGEFCKEEYGKLLCTVGNPCKRGNLGVLSLSVLSQGVGWRATTCAGVCLNQATPRQTRQRGLCFREKTMMIQAGSKHTL